MIQARFAFAEHHPMVYWWPLVCEAMRCQGLGYDNPHYLPELLGDYHVHFPGDMEEKYRQPFRSMWDALHAEHCRGIYASFWSQAADVSVESLIFQESETQEVALFCSLPYLGRGETPEADTLEAAHRVQKWLAVIKAIYRLCRPCTAELTHERWGVEYRMGTIGRPLVLEWWDEPTQHGIYEGDIVQERLPDGAVLSVVTPLRLPWRNNAIPITLRDGAGTEGQDQAEKP